jgi:predicted AlkP superfamily phosphohydrolase/phosphomutase
MKTPVVAIGLDAADPELLETWMAAGHLPNLQKLRDQGGYGRLRNLEYYKAETPWTMFLCGCSPEKIDYWTPVKFFEGSYRVDEIGAYDFSKYPPFYALGENYRVAVFDVPQTVLSKQVNGMQVLAWGAHSPQTPSHSEPPELFAEINSKYGAHPSLHKDHGAWWSEPYLKFLYAASKTGIERRAAICRDWLRQEQWDLLLTIFGEPHSVGHDLWHVSRTDHPLHGRTAAGRSFSSDPMLDVFSSVDKAIGELVAAAPEGAYVMVFAVHGSGNNTTDLASMVFLPEILYRFNFPGRFIMAPGKAAGSPPPMITNPRGGGSWQNNLWHNYRFVANPARRFLRQMLPRRIRNPLDKLLGPIPSGGAVSPAELNRRGEKVGWQPTMWYSPLWPKMRAYALPSFSEGYIRLNLQGREPQGIVAPADYAALCDELTAELHCLVNARSGKSIVKKVIRTRDSAADRRPGRPDADLVVLWDDEPADVVDHSKYGRIGPIPYRRSGSHRARGFWVVKGPGIAPGSAFPEADAIHLPPTILELMGAPIPAHFEGSALIRRAESPAAATGAIGRTGSAN